MVFWLSFFLLFVQYVIRIRYYAPKSKSYRLEIMLLVLYLSKPFVVVPVVHPVFLGSQFTRRKLLGR